MKILQGWLQPLSPIMLGNSANYFFWQIRLSCIYVLEFRAKGLEHIPEGQVVFCA